MPEGELELLRDIDAKLGALVAIALDQYLRETGAAKPRHASVDSMLRAVGLSARDIAGLLGKTERAVHKAWQRDDEAKTKKTRKRAAKKEASS